MATQETLIIIIQENGYKTWKGLAQFAKTNLIILLGNNFYE